MTNYSFKFTKTLQKVLWVQLFSDLVINNWNILKQFLFEPIQNKNVEKGQRKLGQLVRKLLKLYNISKLHAHFFPVPARIYSMSPNNLLPLYFHLISSPKARTPMTLSTAATAGTSPATTPWPSTSARTRFGSQRPPRS